MDPRGSQEGPNTVQAPQGGPREPQGGLKRPKYGPKGLQKDPPTGQERIYSFIFFRLSLYTSFDTVTASTHKGSVRTEVWYRGSHNGTVTDAALTPRLPPQYAPVTDTASTPRLPRASDYVRHSERQGSQELPRPCTDLNAKARKRTMTCGAPGKFLTRSFRCVPSQVTERAR